MNVSLKLSKAPSSEPVTLTEAKLHLRVDTTADDTLIAGLITAARITAENISWRALVTQTWELILDAFPWKRLIVLPRPPLQKVVSITYKIAAGTEQTFAAANYVVDTDSDPGRLALASTASWPGDELYPLGAVKVQFDAGYGDADDVPQIYKQAILLLVGHYYENREQVVASGAVPQSLPMGVEYLLMQDRNWNGL